jgi:spoIIIJ-associated protein
MLKSIESVGRNVEQAIENGLVELKATREDVDIKILEQGGLFRKAKVLITLDKDAEVRISKIEELKNQDESVKKVEEPAKNEEKVDPKQENKQTTTQNDEKTENLVAGENVDLNNVANVASPEIFEKGKVAGEEFIEKIVQSYNIDAEITSSTRDNNLYYKVAGQDLGSLIGYKGETLNAIQYLTMIVVSKVNNKVGRVYVEIGDYKQRRDDSIAKLANSKADECVNCRGKVMLNPMNSYERRIVHSTLADRQDISTYSVGEEPNRCVVIEYVEKK